MSPRNVVACLLLSLSLIAAADAAGALLKSNNSFDLFLFVQFWPGQGGTALPSTIKGWTIHGLWPERNDGTWPQFCNSNNPFNIKLISDLWIDDEEPNNSSALWSHEWDKHGTCATSLSSLATQHDFFSEVLNIHSQVDIYDTLASAGVTPSSDHSYTITQFTTPVKAKYGVPAIFNCEQMNGKQVVEQVVFCVDTTLNFIECNSAITSSLESQAPCGQDIYYPPIEYQTKQQLPIRRRQK